MHPDERKKAVALFLGLSPLAAWLLAVRNSGYPTHLGLPRLLALALRTAHGGEPKLLAAFVSGLALSILLVVLVSKVTAKEFSGAPFRRHLRGTRIVGKRRLSLSTHRERAPEQVTVAGVPMPIPVETLHLLVAGSTGSGKSVLLREMAFSALLRGDRIIVADPNGDMVAKFFQPGDVVLNPYDARGVGWSFFNESSGRLRLQALRPLPRPPRPDQGGGGVVLLRAAPPPRDRQEARSSSVNPTPWRDSSAGPTPRTRRAAGFLAGHRRRVALRRRRQGPRQRSLRSLRQAPEHLSMPAGGLLLRSWLEDPRSAETSSSPGARTWPRPSAPSSPPGWTSSAPRSCPSTPTGTAAIWLFLDELASLEKLPSLVDAATKGRKVGPPHRRRPAVHRPARANLRPGGGPDPARCFRSLVVLGGARTDPKTCEDMSQSLGEHEVEREGSRRATEEGNDSTSSQIQRSRERVVLPSEIATLPDLKATWPSPAIPPSPG